MREYYNQSIRIAQKGKVERALVVYHKEVTDEALDPRMVTEEPRIGSIEELLEFIADEEDHYKVLK